MDRKLVFSTHDKKEAISKKNEYKTRGVRVTIFTKQKYTYPIYNVYVYTDGSGFLVSNKHSNPSLTKGTTLRKFSGKQFYYAGRTLYPSKARLTALELAERGIDVKVTQDRGKGNLIWTEKRTNLDLAEPITGYYRNPKNNNMTKALSMKARYKEDLSAGHKDAAEYWRGQASAYFTGNPTRIRRFCLYCGMSKEDCGDVRKEITERCCNKCTHYSDKESSAWRKVYSLQEKGLVKKGNPG